MKITKQIREFAENIVDNPNESKIQLYMQAYPKATKSIALKKSKELMNDNKFMQLLATIQKERCRYLVFSEDIVKSTLIKIFYDTSEKTADRLNALDRIFRYDLKDFEHEDNDDNIFSISIVKNTKEGTE